MYTLRLYFRVNIEMFHYILVVSSKDCNLVQHGKKQQQHVRETFTLCRTAPTSLFRVFSFTCLLSSLATIWYFSAASLRFDAKQRRSDTAVARVRLCCCEKRNQNGRVRPVPILTPFVQTQCLRALAMFEAILCGTSLMRGPQNACGDSE